MNYQEMWDRLRGEFIYLRHEDVRQIDPILVIGYMDFIKKIEEKQNAKP